MEAIAGWLQIFVIIGVGAAALGAVASAVVFRLFKNTIDDIEPGRRYWLLSALAMAPTAAAMIALWIAFYPSILDFAGIAADHCHSHPGHLFHLCFLHYSPPPIPLPISAVGLAAVGAGVWIWAGELRSLVLSGRLSRRLLAVARRREHSDVYFVDIDRPLAITTGLIRRRVIVSRQLKEELTGQQFAAVIAHEEAHRNRFDGLRLLLLRFVTALHLPKIRRELLEAIELANEQCCDIAAAEAVGDRLAVAEAILTAARARRTELPISAVPSFRTRDIEARIHGLLRNRWQTPNWWLLGPAVLVPVLTTATYLHSFHHLLERVFFRLV